jgi:hypothetical protein
MESMKWGDDGGEDYQLLLQLELEGVKTCQKQMKDVHKRVESRDVKVGLSHHFIHRSRHK